MKKIFLISIFLFSFCFCFTDRATGHQLKNPGTAFWFSGINNVDNLGYGIYANIGLDFALSEKMEMSFDLGRTLGDDFLDSSQSLQLRWWLGSNLSISYAKDFGAEHSDSNFLGLKFLTGNSWLSVTRDSGNSDNTTWSIGRLWERKGKLTIGTSYHFSSDNIDKGNLQLTFGKVI